MNKKIIIDEKSKKCRRKRGFTISPRKIRSDKGWGSGFIISSDGLAVTNQHVIDGSELITVYLHDGTAVDAYVLDQNESVDLALIKIEKEDLKIY